MSQIAKAASVLLARGPASPEVLLVRRAEAVRFFGGFWAFPGGKISPDDAEVPFAPAAPEEDARVRRAAAARELFEETGVLVARTADGSPAAPDPRFAELRREVMEDRLPFSRALTGLGLALRADDFQELGGVTTPPFVPVRFDTAFFVAHLPPGQEVDVWPGELEQGRWTTATAMLDCWSRGECLLSPPTIMILEAFRERTVDEAPARLRPLLRSLAAGTIHPIFWAPDVQMIPLRTLSLPPSTHTNAYLVGREPAYLIDPGPADPAEQQRLFAALDAQRQTGRRLAAVVLTHHHPDHTGAAAACVERYRVPVWAHPLTAAALRGRVEVARSLQEGDRIDLGRRPDGQGTWHLEALHTPGHAPGHLAFYEPHYRLVLAGDMVSTLSSVVIAPPDGDLTVYLDSLRRLRTYDCRLLLPAHGNASARPAATIDETLAHRAKREEQLLAALGPTPRTVAELTTELYKGLPPGMEKFAELQLLAGLAKLHREGRAEPAGEGWRLTERQ